MPSERDLLKAVNEDDTTVIEKYIRGGGDVNYRFKDDYTMLHFATSLSKIDVTQYLLGHGADINAKANRIRPGLNPQTGKFSSTEDADLHYTQHETPLHLVKDLQIAQLLINHGADINSRDSLQMSPLSDAIILSLGLGDTNKKIVRLLISSGADVNEHGNLLGPAAYAILLNDMESLKLLVENGLNVKGPMKPNHFNPLAFAVVVGRDDVRMVSYLIEKGGADPKDQSAIDAAKMMGNQKTIRYLRNKAR